MTVHVIGAGMAGLAAAVRLLQRRTPVTLWEAAAHAGGRVRSLDCPALGRTIDNGTHLLLSGNFSARDYLKAIGATDRMPVAAEAVFPFVDFRDGRRWTVRPGGLPLPLWLLSRSRRVPGASFREYWRLRKLLQAGSGDTVADCLGTTGALVDRFWTPLTHAVMNADPSEAAARPLVEALGETFLRGGKACRPMLARKSLDDALVDPAVRFIEKAKGDIRFGQRLTRLIVLENRVHALAFGDDVVELKADDGVVLALPPWALAKVWPGTALPTETRAIVNAHYRVEGLSSETSAMTGVAGGTVHWVAVRGDVVSVTISAADSLLSTPSAALAARLWPEVAQVLGRGEGTLPPYRVIKERRATPLQSPAMQPMRPHPRTGLGNVILAGDWTATGLPATIEGAIRSGFSAADALAGMDV